MVRLIARLFVVGAVLLWGISAAPAAERTVPQSYTVVLAAPSTGQLLRASRGKQPRKTPTRVGASSVENLRVEVERSQAPVKAAIAAQRVNVSGSIQNVLNAVFVEATAEQARALGEIDGVKRVVRNRRFKLMLNAASDIVGAAEARRLVGGSDVAGAGVRIAVIDTGIDPDHPAFRDASLTPPPGYPKGRPEDLVFTNNKIIAARSYVHLLSPAEVEFSRPDDLTPRDRVGHGTAVAMIAAGKRVSSPAGDLEGVAPKAFLGIYKIFGSPDVNEFSNDNAVLAAIDDAVIDEMDILSISFGSLAQFPWDEAGQSCSDDPDTLCDPVAAAAQSAAFDFGRVVVAAAGNAGAFGEQHFPAKNTISSPATAPDVIAVAATVNARQFTERIRFAGSTVTAIAGTGPELLQPLTAPGALASALGNTEGCRAFAGGSLTGRIVVIQRGVCGFEAKVENAAAGGAVGVVVSNVAGEDEPFLMSGVETTDVPAYMIGAADGATLASRLTGSQVDITLDPTLLSRDVAWDQVAPFSSRGPSPGLNLKPDIAAPGTFIYSAAQMLDTNGDTFHPSGFTQVDGTSFSAPIIAGAAALVWQVNPTLTSREVKSALVNTAGLEVVENGEVARVGSVGGGLVNIPVALEPIATVDPPTVSFGWLEGAAFPIEREILVTNRTTTTQSYRMIVEPRDADSIGRVRIDGLEQLTFQLEPDDFARVAVSLDGGTPAPGSYEGWLRLTQDGEVVDLLVPYLYVVGDNVPHNSFAVAGTGVVATVNEANPELLIAKVIDQYGAPVADLAMNYEATAGGGVIFGADAQTDLFGVIAADVDLGPTVGPQDFRVTGGGLEVPFFNAARRKPTIIGIVNGAGFLSNRPVAPGSIVSIFGEGLAEYSGSLRALPMPLALKHVVVTFDFPENSLSVTGRLFFVSDKQVNVQVPWEFAGLNFVFVKVRIGDSYGEVFSPDLADSAPGIFDFDAEGSRFGIVTHADGSLVTTASPARAGETVIVYTTGNGPVDSPQTTGEAASATSLARTRQVPVVRIGGRQAAVSFSGLTPGFVGLYQVNVVVPAGLTAGNAELVISANGIDSNIVRIAVR